MAEEYSAKDYCNQQNVYDNNHCALLTTQCSYAISKTFSKGKLLQRNIGKINDPQK